jgi:hypothetical protein
MPLPLPHLTGAVYALAAGPVPRIRWTGEWSFVGEAERMNSPERVSAEETAAVGEIYLELAKVDLSDPEAILAFANRFAILAATANDFECLRTFPGFADTESSLRELGLGRRGLPQNEPIAAFAFGARCIRDLTNAFRYLSVAGASPPTWEAARRDEMWQTRSELLRAAGVADQARTDAEYVLEQGLRSSLRAFHPVVGLRAPDWRIGIGVPLYAVCCLEIYNHICREEHPRTCENENCGQQFVRPRGRSTKGQHQVRGVLYCSHACAQAVAARRYRARKRQAANETRG